MVKFLRNIRAPEQSTPFGKAALHTSFIALAGLAFGVILAILVVAVVMFDKIRITGSDHRHSNRFCSLEEAERKKALSNYRLTKHCSHCKEVQL